MFFDPSDIRLERAAAKQAIQISIGSRKEREDIEYEEVEEGIFVEAFRSSIPVYVTKFWFIESSHAQEQSDGWKEDGIYARYSRCL